MMIHDDDDDDDVEYKEIQNKYSIAVVLVNFLEERCCAVYGRDIYMTQKDKNTKTFTTILYYII